MTRGAKFFYKEFLRICDKSMEVNDREIGPGDATVVFLHEWWGGG